jgi:lysophospholipase L1-like esterase
MKPSGSLLFLFCVFCLMMAIALCFPKDGIRIGDNLHLKFFRVTDLLSNHQVQYAKIGTLISNQQNIAAITENDIPITDTLRAVADSLLSTITRLEFPPGQPDVLHSFFFQLNHAPNAGKPIRIMHYGDSQIEDDRITSYLRNRLQSRFGGEGAGLVPASQLYPYGFSMKQGNSDNWLRFAGFGKTDTSIKHNRYGALGSFCRFSADLNTDPDSSEAWIRFGRSSFGYPNTRTYSQCRIFYGFNPEPFQNELYVDNTLYNADFYPAAQGLNIINWTFNHPQSEILLKFRGRSSPEIYGIALDGQGGVAVDNIPLRGSSGLFFTRLNEKLLTDMYRELNVKLFVLQFGGNFVPSGLSEYSGFETWFANQIRRIQQLCPEAAVIVIGVADMSVKERDHYITSPNVEKVRDALKSAAFRSGAAFWDLYKAMGGENSMPSWVFADPPLASGDFVHFNPRGAKIIAQMFYSALMLEYQKFEKHAL